MTDPVEASRVDSTDPLFSNAADGAGPGRRLGVRALVEFDASDQQRLPMLEVICDRMLQDFAASMRALTTDAVEVSLDGVSGGRLGDLLDRTAMRALYGLFRLEPWNSSGLIAIEPDLAYTLVDALLGGRQTNSAPPSDQRAFTTIETSLVRRLFEQLLRDFSTAFAPIFPISARLDRIETSPRSAMIAGPCAVAAHCRFRIDMDGRGGNFALILPITSLDPVREQLTRRVAGDAGEPQQSWAAPIEEAVRALPLPLKAVVGRRVMTLNALKALKPGDHLPFDPEPDAPAALVHDGQVLARAQLGRRSGRAALRLQSGLSREPHA